MTMKKDFWPDFTRQYEDIKKPKPRISRWKDSELTSEKIGDILETLFAHARQIERAIRLKIALMLTLSTKYSVANLNVNTRSRWGRGKAYDGH